MIRDKILEGLVVLTSAFVIVKGDWAYEKMFPKAFWKQHVAFLERREKADLWRVHREEWRLKRAELDLLFALEAAEDEAKCLSKDSNECVRKAKEPFVGKMGEIQKRLVVVKSIHEETAARLKDAREHLSYLNIPSNAS